MGTEQATTRTTRKRVSVFTTILVLLLGGFAHGQDTAGPPSGRGFVWGGGISAGRLGFPGGEDVALAVGEVTGGFTMVGETFEVREGTLVDASGASATDATLVAPLPSSEISAGFSFHAGYAFSRRAAVLLHVELVAGVESGFSSAMGRVVLRP